MTSVNSLAVQLAAIRALQDHLRGLEHDTKAELRQHLDGGDRKYARLPDGETVATVSVTSPKERVVVADDAAFTRWCRTAHPDAVVETVRASDRAAILAAVEDSGEVPDGVAFMPGGDPVVTVRMTNPQREAITAAWREGAVADVLALTNRPASEGA